MDLKQHVTRVMVGFGSLIFMYAGQAGSFSLYGEGNGAATGNYAAGIAAEVADASTAWYNPAGLALIPYPQIVVGGVGVFPEAKLSGQTTFSTPPLFPDYNQFFVNLDGADNGFIPSLYFAAPIGERVGVGLSLEVPFGLSTNWGTTSPTRYSATKTAVMMANFSADLGAQIVNHLAFGLGIDFQYAQVNFNRVLGAPNFTQFFDLPPTYLDSTSENQGDSLGMGFHAGILTYFNENHTRIGLNYQSGVNHQFHGKSRLTGRLADPNLLNPFAFFQTIRLYSEIAEFPEVLTLSAYQDLNARLALLGSIVYTGWSVLDRLQLNNIAAYDSVNTIPALVNFSTQENYRDTWRFALGVNYIVSERFLLRMGGGYDQTPTRTAFRSIRVPDSNRYALAIGGRFQWSPVLSLDVGYTHLFGQETDINLTEDLITSTFQVQAHGKPNGDLVGAQINWTLS